jgi:hypothetical protein
MATEMTWRKVIDTVLASSPHFPQFECSLPLFPAETAGRKAELAAKEGVHGHGVALLHGTTGRTCSSSWLCLPNSASFR